MQKYITPTGTVMSAYMRLNEFFYAGFFAKGIKSRNDPPHNLVSAGMLRSMNDFAKSWLPGAVIKKS